MVFVHKERAHSNVKRGKDELRFYKKKSSTNDYFMFWYFNKDSLVSTYLVCRYVAAFASQGNCDIYNLEQYPNIVEQKRARHF